ncbi:MAG: hypothetical protein AAB338_01070 [Patescibacteria group bacterium]
MALFSIDDPEDFIDHAGLLEIFRHLHQEKWNRFLFGDPYIALEKVVRPSGIRYHIAIPKNCEKILEGRPGLSKINDPFIPRNKFYSAAYFRYLPKKINFDNPKLNEDEGAVLQILVRHLHWIKEKAVFESNLEILVWADSKERARKILGLKSSKPAVFDFFHRIFENRERVRISFKELKDVFLN